MQRTTYKINKMDCASEEQLIRMKLSNIEQVRQLDFDIRGRKLEVYHTEEATPITDAIASLQLGSSLEGTKAVSSIPKAADEAVQKKLLWRVLLINLALFIVEMLTGFIANSMGLIADSLDMLADAVVYALALFAVGGTALRKGRIARFSGYLQLTLAALGLVEVIRRFMGYGDFPVFSTMIIISFFALAGNAASLYLLQKSKSKESHMQASMIFTSNDVVINIGVILAGVMVFLTNSKFPDLVIGICVFIIVGRGAIKILKLS
ncbi:cation transporter [Flavobacterium beibuense]|uniref:cation transporter n=1 Tax=Flavobacterium beibuense TaxID=657326 RepID=UPI003A8DE494